MRFNVRDASNENRRLSSPDEQPMMNRIRGIHAIGPCSVTLFPCRLRFVEPQRASPLTTPYFPVQNQILRIYNVLSFVRTSVAVLATRFSHASLYLQPFDVGSFRNCTYVSCNPFDSFDSLECDSLDEFSTIFKSISTAGVLKCIKWKR